MATAISHLAFSDSFVDTSVKLFELDEPVLQELLECGGRRALDLGPRCPA